MVNNDCGTWCPINYSCRGRARYARVISISYLRGDLTIWYDRVPSLFSIELVGPDQF
jgi:hypothetical protein